MIGGALHKVWDAIAVTCKTAELAVAIKEELEQLRRAGLFAERTKLLTVEDARSNVGSGGATINALTSVCELFCGLEGRSILSFDVLLDKKLLIIHAGRAFAFEPLAAIFLRLPLRYRRLPAFEATLLHWQLAQLSAAIPESGPPGLWVLSGELLLRLDESLKIPESRPLEILAFSLWTDEASAQNNGIYASDEEGFLQQILFQAPAPLLRQHGRVGHGGDLQFPLVAGLVFFPAGAAERLLAVYAQAPLDACTVYGVDSGAPAIQVSLFFDILASMGSRRSEKEGEEKRAALEVMRREMRGCRVRIVRPSGLALYLPSCPLRASEAVSRLCEESLPEVFELQSAQLGVRIGDFLFTQMEVDGGCVLITDCAEGSLPALSRINPLDLWPKSEPRTFRSARLFPVASDSEHQRQQQQQALRWLFGASEEDEMDTWRALPRISLEQALSSPRPALELSARRSAALQRAGRRLNRLLAACPATQPDLCSEGLRPLLRWAASVGAGPALLQEVDAACVAVREEPGKLARALAACADLLAAMAGPEGGLRSGPAGNERFAAAMDVLRAGEAERGLDLLRTERAHWMGTPSQLIRASRHYERAAQTLIGRAVLSAKQQITAAPEPEPREWPSVVTVECPARIDLAGGWSDTPPLCYENGGAVVNASISVNGRLPIGVRVCRIAKPHFVINLPLGSVIIATAADLDDCDNPTSPGALVKATLKFAGLCPPLRCPGPPGLEVTTWTNLPQGSGLGSSSILTGAVLAAVWRVTGWSFSHADLTHGVLCVEQLMTTGGGWQDQVGGTGPSGVQMATSAPGLPLTVTCEPLQPPEDCLRRLNERLVLLYTGKTRLAKNILQDVVRNWYARDDVIANNVRGLVANAHDCRAALLRSDLDAVGACLDRYWAQKKVMAPGSEPLEVTRLLAALRPEMAAQALAGAGGGGFAFGLLREGAKRRELEARVQQLRAVVPEVQLYECQIHVGGIHISVET